jgi:tight adherence protein B
VIAAVVGMTLGAALVVGALVAHRRSEERVFERLLQLPAVPRVADDDVGPVATAAVDAAGQVLRYVDPDGALGRALDRAKVPLRPGEFVIVAGGGTLAAAALILLVTHSAPVAVGGAIATLLYAVRFPYRRAVKRRRQFEAQLPDALSLVASSLPAGHTFLRAIQMMAEESSPPLSDEFSRVVAETRLGDPLVPALERMAVRLEVRDLDMVVQAIRIQQTVGGRLADLLHTLGEFIRARDEIRREVKVLTAEGRMSAYVLAGIVPFLFLVMQVLNPDYVKPLYHGWGLALLSGCMGSVAVGLLVILRMVRLDV